MASCRSYSAVCRRTSWRWCRWSRSAAPPAPPADYSIGAGDGSRPGRINVNEYAPEKRLLLNVEAIAYHEGVPGHHLQFSIAQELTGLPPFRKFNLDLNAYTEGWAFYSERLGKEVGFYQDPYSEYGRLQNEMWRAVRWVVDTGVHSQHWTRQQMVDFFHEHTAMDDQNIDTEVDRYIAWPAQALSYKMGQMKILELRAARAERVGREIRSPRLPRRGARSGPAAARRAGSENRRRGSQPSRIHSDRRTGRGRPALQLTIQKLSNGASLHHLAALPQEGRNIEILRLVAGSADRIASSEITSAL